MTINLDGASGLEDSCKGILRKAPSGLAPAQAGRERRGVRGSGRSRPDKWVGQNRKVGKLGTIYYVKNYFECGRRKINLLEGREGRGVLEEGDQKRGEGCLFLRSARYQGNGFLVQTRY